MVLGTHDHYAVFVFMGMELFIIQRVNMWTV